MTHNEDPAEHGSCRLKLTILDERDGKTSVLHFADFPVRIGRADDNQLILNHPYVSGCHAQLDVGASGLLLKQLGRNAIRVKSRKLKANEAVTLDPGEVIRIVPFNIRLAVVKGDADGLPIDQTGSPAVALGPLGQAALCKSPVTKPLDDVVATHPTNTPMPSVDPESQPAKRAAATAIQAQVDQPSRVLKRLLTCILHQRDCAQQLYHLLDLPGQARSKGRMTRDCDTLLDELCAGPAEATVEELEAITEELVMLQLCIVKGLSDGATTLLARVSPEAVSTEAAQQNRLVGTKTLWQTYKRMHGDLTEDGEDMLQEMFRETIRQAYRDISKRRASGSPKPSGNKKKVLK